jgi:hypothetical protein
MAFAATTTRLAGSVPGFSDGDALGAAKLQQPWGISAVGGAAGVIYWIDQANARLRALAERGLSVSQLQAGGATPRALSLADFLRAEAGGRAAGGPESEEAGEAAAGGRRRSIADHRRASVADSGVGGRRASVEDSGVSGRQGAHAADSDVGDHHASSAADPGWAAMPAPSSELVAGGRRGSAADDLGGTSFYRYEGPEEWGAASPLPEPPLRQAPLQAGLGGATRQRADAMLLLGEEEGSDAARAWSDLAPVARPPQPLVPTRGSVLVPIGARLPRLRPGA